MKIIELLRLIMSFGPQALAIVEAIISVMDQLGVDPSTKFYQAMVEIQRVLARFRRFGATQAAIAECDDCPILEEACEDAECTLSEVLSIYGNVDDDA